MSGNMSIKSVSYLTNDVGHVGFSIEYLKRKKKELNLTLKYIPKDIIEGI